MKKTSNGFATKGDLKKIEKKMDLRFARVDKKLGKIDMRLGIFKLEWDGWKQDALTEFNSRWVNRIDPILAEIEKHREKEVIWAEQNQRMERKVDKFGEGLEKVGERLETVAKKIGV